MLYDWGEYFFIKLPGILWLGCLWFWVIYLFAADGIRSENKVRAVASKQSHGAQNNEKLIADRFFSFLYFVC